MNTSTLCDGALLKNRFGLNFLRSGELDSSNLTAKFWFKIESESGSRKGNAINWLNESINLVVWLQSEISGGVLSCLATFAQWHWANSQIWEFCRSIQIDAHKHSKATQGEDRNRSMWLRCDHDKYGYEIVVLVEVDEHVISTHAHPIYRVHEYLCK